ncbi:MAG: hypothetical protein ACM31O_05540, partial [Bacteroidota bacterium]
MVRHFLADHDAPRLTVVVGATLMFALLVKEYFEPYPYYGPKKIAAVVCCGALMATGALWEVLSGKRTASDACGFWAVAGYVALLLSAFRFYQIENRAFFEFITLLTFFGFVINHYLEQSYRKPFFLLLSVIGIVGVFGAGSLVAAVGLVLIGLGLFAICHLPISMWARIALLAACAAGLALVRIGWLYAGWAAVILP